MLFPLYRSDILFPTTKWPPIFLPSCRFLVVTWKWPQPSVSLLVIFKRKSSVFLFLLARKLLHPNRSSSTRWWVKAESANDDRTNGGRSSFRESPGRKKKYLRPNSTVRPCVENVSKCICRLSDGYSTVVVEKRTFAPVKKTARVSWYQYVHLGAHGPEPSVSRPYHTCHVVAVAAAFSFE